MRTTLNLDEDVASRLAEIARSTGTSLSRAVNDVLRSGLRSLHRGPKLEPYSPPVFDTGRARLDVTDIAHVLDALDDG
jgi:hypothetical protein